MAYTAAEIKSAIDISRSQGFSDADIATGLGRYLPDAASVTAALAANPRVAATTTTATADTTAATTYTPTQIKSAIDVSRAQGFSDADIATGLGRYLPNAAAVTTALAANPRPVSTTTTTSTTGTGGTATTTGTGGTSTTVPRTYTQDEITSAINISRQQGFSDAEIARITDTFKGWCDGKFEDIDGFCKSVSREEIAKNNDSLSPGRYIGTEEVESENDEDFATRMQALTSQLSEQLEESRRLESLISEQLKGLGYDI